MDTIRSEVQGGLPVLPIIQVGEEQAFSPEETIYVLTRFLANQCDGARDLDGIGFNRLHSQAGKSLALMPFKHWTDKQLWYARRMLATYKSTQLAPWWEHVPEIPHPDDRQVVDIATRKPIRTIPVNRKMILVRHDDKTYVGLQHDYDQALVNTIKSLPRAIRRWDDQLKCWLMPLEYEVLEQVAGFAVEYGYELDEDVMGTVDGLLTEVGEKIDLSYASEGHIDIEGFGDAHLKLRPFQAAAVDYALRVMDPLQSKGMLDADEQGLGKTPTAIAISKAINANTTIVICPASVKWNWKREIERWIPGAHAHVIQGGKTYPLIRRNLFGEEPLADFFIIGYSAQVFKRWRPIFAEMDPDLVIMDEIHNLRNFDTKQAKEIYGFLRGCHARVVPIGLSGTPMVNNPKDFANIVRMVGQTQAFGWSGDPNDKVGEDMYYSQFKDATGTFLRKINKTARMHFMVRRLKKDVLTELPDKVRQIIEIDLDNRAEYEEKEANLAHYFAQKRIESEKFALRCRMEWEGSWVYDIEDKHNTELDVDEYSTFEEWFHERKKEHYGKSYWIAQQSEQLLKWEFLKEVCIRGKTAGVVQWIDEFLASTDEKIVLFVWHNQLGRMLAERYGADFINGEMQPQHRQVAVDRFQTDPSVRVIVGNLIAAGEGITLTAASHICMLELGWNPKTMNQAEDRCHRIGQKDSVNVYTLTARDTIEDDIAEIIQEKLELSEGLVDGDSAATQKTIMAELERKLRDKMGM